MSSDITNKLMHSIARSPSVDTPITQSMLYSNGYSEEQVFSSISGANLLFALNRAREARDLAVSYRGFNVGASVMAFEVEKSQFAFYSGFNIKPEEETEVNVHAEQLALTKIINNIGAVAVITMVVVVGKLQADTQSGHLAHTLHPCGLCRNALTDSGLLNQERTLVVSALPDFRTIEMYSPQSLHRFHETGDSSGIYRVLDLPDMELLKPFEPKDSNKPYRLVENPTENIEEKIWFEKVGLPLFHFSQSGQWPETLT